MDQSLKILIIDDEEPILSNLCYFLNEKGYDVTSASDGLKGLKLFKEDTKGFDLIITDVVMPKLSGMSLISIIKEKSPEIPIIAITGWGEFPDAFALDSQADKVLSKPFELSVLDKTIDEIISSKKQSVLD